MSTRKNKNNKRHAPPASKWEAAAWALPAPIESLRAPFAVLTGEAIDVARFCQRNWHPILGVNEQIIKPGLKSAVGNGTFTEQIAEEIVEIQAELQVVQSKYRLLVSGPSTAPMDRAQFVLAELRSTLQWLFNDGKDDDSDAQLATLNAEHQGAISQDDVAAALFDYAELAGRHRQGLAGLGGFDPALIDEAQALGGRLRELSAGPAVTAAPPEDVRALELRNRLGMLLYDRMQRVRSAARFVFRNHPDSIREVTSSYGRRQRTANRNRQPSPSPTPPVVAPTNGTAPAPAAAPAFALHAAQTP